MLAKQSGIDGLYEHNNAPRLFLTAAEGNKIMRDANGNYSVTLTKTVPSKIGDFAIEPAKMEIVAFVHGSLSSAEGRVVANAIEQPLME